MTLSPPTPPIADSHVHLDMAAFDDDRAHVVRRAAIAGVRAQVVPAVDASSWPRIHQLCRDYPAIFPAYGLHPLFLQNHRSAHLESLPDWLRLPETVAVGEIGLDFYRPHLDADTQRHFFQRQLELARSHNLPVIVHARRALEEVIQHLRRFPGLRGVIHSFSGSLEQATQLWNLGFHLGIGGPVTYARAQRLRRIVAHMPVEFLLLESDAPDQPDASHQGQRNEPAFIGNVLSSIAELRNESVQDIAEATLRNTRALFKLDLSLSRKIVRHNVLP